jgi:hypothetical protein
MRRLLGSVVLVALLAASLLAAGPAAAAAPVERDGSPSLWRSVLDVLSLAVFGASETETGPDWDPDGLQKPSGGGEGGGAADEPSSGNTDTGPDWDPDG